MAYAATFNGERDIYFGCGGGNVCTTNTGDNPRTLPSPPNGERGAIVTHSGSYDCNANGVPDECEYRGGFDGDRVTTLQDFAAFQRCFTGDAAPIADPCFRLFDLSPDGKITEGDDDADLDDLAKLQLVFAGP